nr:MAG TPA: major tail protein [Caudoviricetes sp.]
MAKVLNGFTANTATNLQLDAGIFVRGLADPSSFTGTVTTPAKTIGATSGGGSFTAIPTFRNIFEDLDGARGVYKGGQVIDSWEIKMTTTIKEMTAENLKLALAAADTSAASSGKYDTTVARLEVKEEDYLDNFCFIGTINGQDTPVIIEMKNVLNMSGLNLTVADKATGSVSLELQAHFDLSKPDEVPFKIYTPKVGA